MSVVAHNIIKNTGFLYAKMGITVFISLWTTRLILNSLGSSDFGLFNLIGGAIATLGFLNSTMSFTTQRFMSYSEGEGDGEKKKRIFNISLVLHLFIALGTGLLLTIAGFFFFQGGLNIPQGRELAAQVVYASLVMSTIFTVAAVPYDAAITAHENMKYYAVVGIFEALLKLLVAFACTYTHQDKLIVYGVLMAIIPLITLVILLRYCHKHYEECVLAPRRYWDKQQAKSILSFASWNFLGATTSLVGKYGLGLVLNQFFGTLLNAAQGIAAQLNGQLLAFSNSMLKAVNPALTRTEGEGDKTRVLSLTITSTKVSYFILALFVLPAIAEMPYILKLWLKNVPAWAIIFTQLQLVRSLVEQITLVLSTAINAEGRIATYNKVVSFLNLLPILLSALAFAQGATPVFMYWITIIVFGVAVDVLRVYYMKKNCGLSYSTFFRQLLLPIIGVSLFTSGIAGVSVWVMEEGFFRLLLTLLGCTLGLLLAIWVGGLNEMEKDYIRLLWRKLRKRT